MSVDICFWKYGNGAPHELYDAACEGEVDAFESSGDVLNFRSALIERWPECRDSIEPLMYDPDLEEQEDLSLYVLITLSVGRAGLINDIVNLAIEYGLTGFDPQTGSAVEAPPAL